MTVASLNNKTQTLGNGATVAFPFTFRILAASHLIVTRTVIATGVNTELVLNTDYTVSGVGSYNGGTVTCTVAPATGTRLTIRRVVPLTQATDLRNQGAYFAETHEDVFDKSTMIDQQLTEESDRAVKFPTSDVAPTSTLPGAAARANKVLAFDADGNPIASTTDAANVVAAASAAAAAAASVSAAGLPGSLVGKALNWLRVKADELGYEFRTAGQLLTDIGGLAKAGDSMTGPLNEARATVASHATTADIWAAAGNSINFTGTATVTDFPDAPQAGATRVLHCAGATVFTDNANLDVQGGATYTASVGDIVVVEAVTVSTFKLTIFKDSGTPTAQPMIHVRDEKASGTVGGAATAGSYAVRTLNTVVSNTIVGASLASNRITLPPGNYRLFASAPAYRCDFNKIKIWNATDGAIVPSGIGSSEYTANAGVNSVRSVINGLRFTLATAKDIELRHYALSNTSTTDFGVNTANGDVEVYSEVFIVKE
jgi:hypothetical protein